MAPRSRLTANMGPAGMEHIDSGSGSAKGPGSSSRGGLLVEPGSHQQIPPVSGLQVGMYVLLGVFCLAVLVFAVNCSIMVMRYRRQAAESHQDQLFRRSHTSFNGKRHSLLSGAKAEGAKTGPGTAVEEYADMNWVWLGTEQLRSQGRLQRGSCTERLLSPGCYRQANPRDLTGSFQTNRLSSCGTTLQTMYEGQECSIRILTNPLDKEAEVSAPVLPLDCISESRDVEGGEKEEGSSSSPQHLYYNQHENLQWRWRRQQQQQQQQQHESAATADAQPPAPPVRTTSRQATTATSTGSRSSALSGVQWDHAVAQMSYEELLAYFDNMRETVT